MAIFYSIVEEEVTPTANLFSQVREPQAFHLKTCEYYHTSELQGLMHVHVHALGCVEERHQLMFCLSGYTKHDARVYSVLLIFDQGCSRH